MKVSGKTLMKQLYVLKIISMQTYNSLIKTGIFSFNDLAEYTKQHSLYEIQNCDDESLLELKKYLVYFLNKDVVSSSLARKEQYDNGVIARSTKIRELFDGGFLTVRALNCCEYNDIFTVGDLLRYKLEHGSFLCLRNCGKKTMKEFEVVIHSSDVKHTVNKMEGEYVFGFLPQSVQSVINQQFEDFSKRIVAEKTSAFTDTFQNPFEFYFCVTEDIRTYLSKYFKLANRCIQRDYYLLLNSICTELEQSGFCDSTVCQNFRLLISIISLEDEGLFKEYNLPNSLPKNIKEVVVKAYESKVSSLSVRARRVQQKKMQTFADAFKYFGMPAKQFDKMLFPGQTMKKTSAELFGFIQDFKSIFIQYLTLNDKEMATKRVEELFPFLLKKQQEFVCEFHVQYGHYPMFYVLKQYVTNSDNRDDYIFAMLNGLFDGVPRTLEEIGQVMELTKERVRQVASNGPSKEILSSLEWKKYDVVSFDAIFPDSQVYHNILNTEKVDVSFKAFGNICSYIFPFVIKRTNGFYFLLSKQYNYSKTISRLFRNIERMARAKYSTTYRYNIDPLITSVHKANRESFKRIMLSVIYEAYGLEYDDNNNVIFLKNRISVGDELCSILNSFGKPMSLDELFYAIKNKLPNIKYEDPSQIRSYLLNNDKIKPIGKTSTYGLSTWDNVFYGSIRDLVVKVLDMKNEPVSLDDIMEQIIAVFPNTNKKSVASSLSSDPAERFVSFSGGYYGLSEKIYDSRFILSEDSVRCSFGERLKQLETFIEEYHRFPFSNGGLEEGSISRWLNRVNNNLTSATAEQKNQLFCLLDKYKDYPQNGNEYEFLLNCKSYMEFVEENYQLAKVSTNRKLYNWYRKTHSNYYVLTGNKKKYFDDLLQELRIWEFDV